MFIKKKNYFPFLILLIGVVSVNQWSRFPIGNTFFIWAIQFLMIGYILRYIKRHGGFRPTDNYRLLFVYLLVAFVGIVRGCFVAENYWEWKQLISGSMSLLLPLFIYVFREPVVLGDTLRFWYKWGITLFFLFIFWFVSPSAYGFYACPILLIGCFLPVVKDKKWRLFIVFFIFLTMFISLGARSHVIKGTICLMMSLAYYFAKYMTDKVLRIVHWFCYILPVILLALGISGIFNIFEGLSEHKGKYAEKKVVDGQVVEEDLAGDTRTFIYVEVIESALRHDYVWWGRTPARGNDSVAFGAFAAEELKTGKYERHSNEVCHPNVFTWLGLVGMVLYSLLYLQASWLAIYRSNNLLIKLLGCYVAFRWAYGWIEDVNNFSISSITLWAMIAMCFSSTFRNMRKTEIEYWINNL